MVEEGQLQVGDWVCYHAHYPEGKLENGIVKEIVGKNLVRVVYNCNDDWNNYMDYNSALTDIRNLTMGWK